MQGFRELILLHLAHDAERQASRAQDELRKRLDSHETAIATATAELEAADAEVKRIHAEKRAAEIEVQKIEDQRKKYRDQLMGAKTNEIYKTLLHEIETAGKQISLRETVVLESLEAMDGVQSKLEAAKKVLAAAKKGKADEEAKIAADLESHEAERREAATKAGGMTAAVPPGLLSHYLRVREQRDGRGMAMAIDRTREQKDGRITSIVVDYLCGECRVAVRPQVWVDMVAKQEPAQCVGCQRFLYRKENLEGVKPLARKAEDAPHAAGSEAAAPTGGAQASHGGSESGT